MSGRAACWLYELAAKPKVCVSLMSSQGTSICVVVIWDFAGDLSCAALDVIFKVLDNVSTGFEKQSSNGFSVIHNTPLLIQIRQYSIPESTEGQPTLLY